MRFIVIRNVAELKTQTPLPAAEVLAYTKLQIVAGRATIYSIPIAIVLWIYLALPHVYVIDKTSFWFALQLFAPCIYTAFLHEIVHGLAIPTKLTHPDTAFGIHLQGLRSYVFFRPGGRITREQFIWMSILPFIVLTVIPFTLLASGHSLPLWLGLLASINLGLSSLDVMKSVLLLKLPFGAILREE
ncbi:MAG: DUF3267 domain-containing protein [bacterium]|jgi:hypothetical protein